VTGDGTPADPGTYDYTRTARHFAALFDRCIQNLRRYCGYDIQADLTLWLPRLDRRSKSVGRTGFEPVTSSVSGNFEPSA
jgi:hypothetical protein